MSHDTTTECLLFLEIFSKPKEQHLAAALSLTRLPASLLDRLERAYFVSVRISWILLCAVGLFAC